MSKSKRGNRDLKSRLSVIRFCKRVLAKHKIITINDRYVNKCKHKEIINKYVEITGDSSLSNYNNGDKEIEGEYVYVIINSTKDICKIGYSKNPYRRLSDVQVGNHLKLRLYLVFKGGHDTEKRLHAKYRNYRMNGEWFRFEGDLKNNLLKIKRENENRIFI